MQENLVGKIVVKITSQNGKSDMYGQKKLINYTSIVKFILKKICTWNKIKEERENDETYLTELHRKLSRKSLI